MSTQQTSKGLHIGLWIAQGFLAAIFAMTGLMKIYMPVDQLAQQGMSFVANYDPLTVRFIGISELLACLGLILPSALRIWPILSPLAAAGISIIMTLATHYHFTHHEPFIPTVVLFSIAAFIVWGRYYKAPIQAKYGR